MNNVEPAPSGRQPKTKPGDLCCEPVSRYVAPGIHDESSVTAAAAAAVASGHVIVPITRLVCDDISLVQ